MNKITHSYTVQYAITTLGKLLPTVLSVCKKEVVSGKLWKETYKCFLDNVIEPYVEKDKFLLILDSRGGQTNPALYDKFLDESDEPTCSLK
jgi:hypothetical protein